MRREFGIRADAVVGLYVGALNDVKDTLVAARATRSACSQGAEFVLLVAGEGPLRGAVQAEGGEHVRVLGFRHDVSRLNALADVFVLPSRREGLSYALLAAMAAGAAPIVSDIPGNVEAVGDTGVIVPVGDVAALADTLTRLVADPEARRQLGVEAQARVKAEFREDVMLERTRAVYDSVCKEHRQRRTS